MPWVGSMEIPLICTDSLSKKQRTYWSSASSMHSLPARLTCTCMLLTITIVYHGPDLDRSTASSAKATIPPITFKRSSPEWSKYVKNSAYNTLQKQTQVECTSTSRVDPRKCLNNSPKVITDTIRAMETSTAVSNIKASNIRKIIISKTRISKAATKANSNHTINREIMNRTINKTKRSKRP